LPLVAEEEQVFLEGAFGNCSERILYKNSKRTLYTSLMIAIGIGRVAAERIATVHCECGLPRMLRSQGAAVKRRLQDAP
jgi:hypothetical protein